MNLLPQQDKLRIRREIAMRLSIYAVLSLILLEVVSLLMISPSYIVANALNDAYGKSAAQLKQTVSGKGSVDDELKKYSADIKGFIGERNYTVDDALLSVLSVRPDDVSIATIAFSRSGTGMMQLSGSGATREGLLEYQRRLRELPNVADARYGENFLTKKVDISFGLVITFK